VKRARVIHGSQNTVELNSFVQMLANLIDVQPAKPNREEQETRS
jgi:hypothetical protein